MSFFESRSWWKDDIYWLRRSSCFELFGDGIYGLFYSQKVDGKMIFIWSFLPTHRWHFIRSTSIFNSNRNLYAANEQIAISTALHYPKVWE